MGSVKNVALSKWGNSLGIRIPASIAKGLGLRVGDQVAFELKDDTMMIRKKKTTVQMFEEFYGKPFSEITQDDIGSAEELDWGADVGGEVIR